MWTVDDLRGHAVYLDSNIFIYAFEARDAAVVRVLGALFADIRAGATLARTSLITRAEVLVRPLRDRQIDLVHNYQRLLSGARVIGVEPLDIAIVDRAAELRAARRGLRLPDAIHLATAMLLRCPYFVTSDKRLSGTWPSLEVLQLHLLTGN